jgi:hypothetical protein
MESEWGSNRLLEYDLFRKLASTFRDHALEPGSGDFGAGPVALAITDISPAIDTGTC